MATESKSRRRRRKKVLMRSDGSLYDASERRRITHAELRDHVKDGGLFEARRHESGADCTFEVLQSVMGIGFLQNMIPGLGSGIPGLSSLAGAAGGIGELAKILGGGDRSGGGWDDWDEPPRKRKTDDRGWGDVGSDFD